MIHDSWHDSCIALVLSPRHSYRTLPYIVSHPSDIILHSLCSCVMMCSGPPAAEAGHSYATPCAGPPAPEAAHGCVGPCDCSPAPEADHGGARPCGSPLAPKAGHSCPGP